MGGRLPPAPLSKSQSTSPTHPIAFQTLAQCQYLSLLQLQEGPNKEEEMTPMLPQASIKYRSLVFGG